MIRRNSGRSKFISLLMVLTMVFSMIMPMGVWAASGDLSISPSGDKTFTPVTEGYSPVTPYTVEVSNTTTGALINVTVAVSTDEFLINGNVTTTPAVIAASLTTTPASFEIKPKDDLPVGTYTATVTIEADGGATTSFIVTQAVNSTGPASTNIVDISGPGNKMIVGDYLVDLNEASDKFTLNNFIKMAQTAYDSNTSGYPIYHVYYYTGEDNLGNPIWIDLVTMEEIAPEDIEDMNGTGQFVYTDEDLWLDSEVFGPQ